LKSYFARRSEPLTAAAEVVPQPSLGVFKWMFNRMGQDEPTQVRADVGAPIRSIVRCVTGVLVALGVGETPGHGTCERYWVDGEEEEVLAGTAGARARVRGGTGDVQLRTADGVLTWFSGAHCRPWVAEDGPLPAGLKAAVPPPLDLLPTEPPRPPSPPPPLRSTSPVPDAMLPAETLAETPMAAESRQEHAAAEPATVADVEAERLSRQLKHELLRAHLQWLVASSPRFKAQRQLADVLAVSAPWLSQYMSGLGGHGKPLLPSELSRRHSTILSALTREGLPSETPTADDVAAAASHAATAAAAASIKG